LDEIEKIGQDLSPKPKRPMWKRIARQTLGYSAGYAAGHATGMLLEHAAKKVFKGYKGMPPESQKSILAPLLGLATVGAMVGHQVAEQHRQKVLRDE
jgi:hypothetical protein